MTNGLELELRVHRDVDASTRKHGGASFKAETGARETWDSAEGLCRLQSHEERQQAPLGRTWLGGTLEMEHIIHLLSAAMRLPLADSEAVIIKRRHL